MKKTLLILIVLMNICLFSQKSFSQHQQIWIDDFDGTKDTTFFKERNQNGAWAIHVLWSANSGTKDATIEIVQGNIEDSLNLYASTMIDTLSSVGGNQLFYDYVLGADIIGVKYNKNNADSVNIDIYFKQR